MAGKDKSSKLGETEGRRMSRQTTKVYLDSVMRQVFKEKWSDHLEKLLEGDRDTLDLCARHLSKDLAFFQLLHVLCLVTGTRFDLEEKDKLKAADQWLVWYAENKSKLTWDKEAEHWALPK